MVFLFEDDVQKGVWVWVCFWGCSICGVVVFLVGPEGLVRKLNVSWEESWCKWVVGVRDATVCEWRLSWACPGIDRGPQNFLIGVFVWETWVIWGEL